MNQAKLQRKRVTKAKRRKIRAMKRGEALTRHKQNRANKAETEGLRKKGVKAWYMPQ